jgi:hypothetical protein
MNPAPSPSWHPCDHRALADLHAERRRDAADHEEAEPEREMTIEREVFVRLCQHWFSAGPQPEEVLQRVFAAAADRRPDLLRGLSKKEIALAREESARGRKWRLQAIFPGNREPREKYRSLVESLRAAFSGARRPSIERVTLRDALTLGKATEPPEATETLSRVLEKIFRGGIDPRAIAQATFALTGWLFRDLQLNMSLEALGNLFDEERATQSWRSKTYIEEMLRAAGFRGCKTAWQKPQSAVAHYAESAQGNTNRRRKRRFSAPLTTSAHTHKNP